MAIKIKKVDVRDVDIAKTLIYLQKKCLPGDDLFDTATGHWWVVYDEFMLPIGFAGMVRSYSWYDCGYLCRAGVLKDWRGQGIQKKLLKAREKHAKKLGWNWLISDTTDNPASSNSLINCGFKMYDPSKPWGFKHTLYWRKKLNAVQRPGNKKKKTCGVLEEILQRKQRKSNC
jgi:GNAT superfamily N-acetyltransferase